MSPPINDEAALLARARELDSRALGQIHDRYYPEIYRFALYRTSAPETAADIASEVFLRLLDALHAGRAPQTTLRGWLFGVASHLVADHFRRTPRESAPLEESLMATASPAAEAEERVRKGQVQAAIRRLTPEQQEVLALRFADGFSVEQTAEATGKSVTAVKSLQFRALDTLRKWLVEMEND
jgi:RNA polymerase sigma-70 factor (ECF subfamily)